MLLSLIMLRTVFKISRQLFGLILAWKIRPNETFSWIAPTLRATFR